MIQKLFTVKELSGIINVKEDTLYTWVNQKKIPYIKLSKKVLFNPSKIEAWINEHEFESIEYDNYKRRQ